MSRNENPILVIKPTNKDLRPPITKKPGPPKIFGNGDSEARRQALAEQTDNTLSFLKNEFERWPNLSAVAKITLKEEALAKSHRPTSLFTKTTCPIIGTMGFGEILVSVTPAGLLNLKNKILTTEALKPSANISTIDKIEPFTENERLNFYNWNQLEDKIQNDLIKLSIFDHQNDKKKALLHKDLKCKAPLIESNLRRNLGKWST